MNYKVYIMKSVSHGNRYAGSTENVGKMINEHNSGKCRYTKGRRPWQLIAVEEFETRGEAMKREKFLKSGKGREFLDNKYKE